MTSTTCGYHRQWSPPDGADLHSPSNPATLRLYNSLLDEKVPFIPAAGSTSKNISWYTCGPTVYDSAHMGHARNYMGFDIVRRVLEDYFGYSCLFVMNVTDVDDKIILRARRNHLMEQYCSSSPAPAEVGGAGGVGSQAWTAAALASAACAPCSAPGGLWRIHALLFSEAAAWPPHAI